MAAVEAPMEPMQLEIMAEPVIATMRTSHLIQDETMGVTYMDTVTISTGRVALTSSCVATCPPRPTIGMSLTSPRKEKMVTTSRQNEYDVCPWHYPGQCH